MRRLTVLLFVALCCLCIMGCSTVPNMPGMADSTAVPADTAGIESYTDDRLNLGDIYIQNETGASIVTLLFYQDASLSGVAPSDRLPRYETSYIDGLNRVVIRLKNTKAVYPQRGILSIEDRVQAVFHLADGNAEGDMCLILQLREHCILQLAELDNQLLLTLTPSAEAAADSSWYVQINDVTLVSVNEDLRNMGFTPAICVDGETITLLSRGFSSRGEAMEFLTAQEANIARILPEAAPVVTCIESGGFPTKEIDADFADTVSEVAVMPDGSSSACHTLISNGRFLCWSQDKDAYLFSKIVKLEDGSNYTYEQLFMQKGEKTVSLLPDVEFSSLSGAAFSGDGRYIAFLDYADICRSLMIFDSETKTLYNGDEIGFGLDTPVFVWHDQKPILYAITGEGEYLSIRSVDMENTDAEPWEYTGIYPDEGSLAYRDGCIFFCKSIELTSKKWIYRMDIAAQTHEAITEGSAFVISPDGTKMAISCCTDTMHPSDTKLKLYELQQKTELQLADIQDIMYMVWENNNTDFYAVSYRNAPVEDHNQLSLWKYSGTENTVTELLYMMNGDVFGADVDGSILLSVQQDQGEVPVYITYTVTVSES